MQRLGQRHLCLIIRNSKLFIGDDSMRVTHKQALLGNELHLIATLDVNETEYYGSCAIDKDSEKDTTDDERELLAIKRAIERYELSHNLGEDTKDIYAAIGEMSKGAPEFRIAKEGWVIFTCPCGNELQITTKGHYTCSCGRTYQTGTSLKVSR